MLVKSCGIRLMSLVVLALASGACEPIDEFQVETDGGFLDFGFRDTGPRYDGGDSIPSASVLARFVLDGDTILLQASAALKTPDGRPLDGEKVRLIGVDAPEIEHPGEPAECWGDEAMAFLASRVEGRIVQVSYDPSSDRRDRFGRLLAYVSVGGAILNEELLTGGHGRVLPAFPHRESSRYRSLEASARNQGLGLWSCP